MTNDEEKRTEEKGKKEKQPYDKAGKEYLSDNDRFASLVNQYVYKGKQVVDPKSLKDVPLGGLLHTRRDILKEGVVKTDDKVVYAVFGLENYQHVIYNPCALKGYACEGNDV